MSGTEEREITNLIFELGHLKKIKREGWRFAGVSLPESVAEHALRAAQIGFILARMEGYENPHEVCAMVVFHELEECRLGDVHTVAKRYAKLREEECAEEQTEGSGEIGREIFGLWKRVKEAKDRAAVIARDADLLEMAFTAREYEELGYPTWHWLNVVSKRLSTRSAKKLFEAMLSASPRWWREIMKD